MKIKLIKMKALYDKPIFIDSISSKRNGKGGSLSNNLIKLRTVTDSERQQLRIPTYKYILP